MEVIEDIDSVQDDSKHKRVQLVKTFGWISFGLAVFYFFGGLIGMFSSSMFDTFGSFARLGRDAMPTEYLEWMDTLSSLMFYQSIVTFIVAGVMLVGSVGFATLNEWGRTTYVGACFGAIAANIFNVYVSQATTSGMADMMNAMPDNPGINFGSAMGSMGLMMAIVAAVIPLTYLVFNIIIANKPLTKEVMRG